MRIRAPDKAELRRREMERVETCWALSHFAEGSPTLTHGPLTGPRVLSCRQQGLIESSGRRDGFGATVWVLTEAGTAMAARWRAAA